MTCDSLHALAFSTDRLLLRRLTRLLKSVGCRVDQLAQMDRAVSVLDAMRPDFVIVDGDLPAETLESICRTAVDDLDAGPPPVVLALSARHDARHIAAVLAAGVDDVLHSR